MTYYKYAQLDNRPTPEARAHNEAIFASGPVWGLEVTNKGWARRCEVNIDPQHGNSKCTPMNAGVVAELFDNSRAACEVAQFIDQPPATTQVTLLFDRVDLDAICAAAILELREGPEDVAHKIADRIRQVAEADNFKVGKTLWRPYPLPTKEHPWVPGSVDSRKELAAINRAIQDRAVSLETRVQWTKEWLLFGREPLRTDHDYKDSICRRCGLHAHQYAEHEGRVCSYRSEVEYERLQIVAALERGDNGNGGDAINIALACGSVGIMIPIATTTSVTPGSGDISIIEMSGKPYPGATGIGFALAPVTICIAEHFQPGDYRKVSIASWGVLSPEQMAAIRDRLNSIETIPDPTGAPADRVSVGGWGGNLQSGILGSPQGRSTNLSVEQIIAAIRSVM